MPETGWLGMAWYKWNLGKVGRDGLGGPGWSERNGENVTRVKT